MHAFPHPVYTRDYIKLYAIYFNMFVCLFVPLFCSCELGTHGHNIEGGGVEISTHIGGSRGVVLASFDYWGGYNPP